MEERATKQQGEISESEKVRGSVLIDFRNLSRNGVNRERKGSPATKLEILDLPIMNLHALFSELREILYTFALLLPFHNK